MSDASVNTQDQQDAIVSKKVHDEVVQDLLKQKSALKEMREKLSVYEKEKEELGLKGLKEKQEWQKVAEAKEREAEELKKKLDSTNKATTNYFKRSELRQQALKAGIRAEALDDLDLLSLDDLQVETTSTGNVNVLGADKFVERLKTTRSYWFETKRDPGVDGSTPTVTKAQGAMTPKEILKLQKEGKHAEYETALKNYYKR